MPGVCCVSKQENFLKEDKLAALEQIENVVKVRYTEHVLPVLSQFDMRVFHLVDTGWEDVCSWAEA